MYFLKGKRIAAYFTVVETTKQLVILNAKRERIRIPLKRKTDCHSRLHGFAMTKAEERIAAYFTVVEITKRLVILSAWRERIRNTLKRGTDRRSYAACGLNLHIDTYCRLCAFRCSI